MTNRHRSAVAWHRAGCNRSRSQPTYQRFEIALWFFSRAPVLETEAHLPFHHHTDLDSGCDARSHRPDPCHLGDDRV